MNKLKALWAGLPNQVQAAMVSVGTAIISGFVHAASEGGCFKLACLKHYLATAIAAGLLALRAFYLVPSKAAQK